MSAKIINMMQFLIENREESLGAVKRAMQRPFPHERELPLESRGRVDDADRMASWFLESLWLEGFRVVRASDEE